MALITKISEEKEENQKKNHILEGMRGRGQTFLFSIFHLSNEKQQQKEQKGDIPHHTSEHKLKKYSSVHFLFLFNHFYLTNTIVYEYMSIFGLTVTQKFTLLYLWSGLQDNSWGFILVEDLLNSESEFKQ